MSERYFVENVLERAGCPLHYWLGGRPEQPLIVFTHAALLDHHAWELQIPMLLEGYRVLLWDLRGHGRSQPFGTGFSVEMCANDLLAILDHLGEEQAIFVGHSLGGNVTQELVFYHPERVKALVMLGCTCNTLKLSSVEAFLLKLTPLLLRLFPYDLLLRQSAQISSIREEIRHALLQSFRKLPRASCVRILTATTRCLHYEPGYRIMQPLLLTHGASDQTGNIRQVGPKWAVREPQCRYIVIPNAGHVAQLDNPDAFNRILLDFLQTLADRSSGTI